MVDAPSRASFNFAVWRDDVLDLFIYDCRSKGWSEHQFYSHGGGDQLHTCGFRDIGSRNQLRVNEEISRLRRQLAAN